MANDLNDIKQLLRQTPTVKPNETAKKTAISLALQEYDKNNLKFSQENNKAVRPMAKTTRRSTAMKTYQIALIGTFCVLFMVLAIVPLQTPTNWQLLEQTKSVFVPSNEADQQVASVQSNEGKTQQQTELRQQEAKKDAPLVKSKEERFVRLDDVKTTNSVQTQAVVPAEAKPTAPSKTEPTVATSIAPAPAPPIPLQPMATEAEDDAMGITGTGILPDILRVTKNPPVNNTVILPKRNLPAKKEAGVSYGVAVQPAAPVVTPATTADALQAPQYQDQGRDKFEEIKVNPLKLTKDEPVSTFSIDVDTASYSFVRGSLNQNVLPQKDAVRVEELINYFPYQYQAPTNKEEPFKANVSVLPTPWNKDTKLMHIGIKGYQLDAKAKPQANLVFLIDSSGSMNEPNKLPLVQNSLKMLLDSLNENDSVAIVTYAGGAGVALEPTKVKDKAKISAVIDGLGARGSTAGAEGIRQAYQLAEQNLNKDGINRVILATDGDFNVGITDQNELKSFIERKRTTGVTLSVLGFGMGNYNDALMQTLAQNGNGNAAYIDNLNEARKTLVEQAGSTLFTIAKDVKIQVEFNPEQVAEYRLIGYETRLLKREDFNNDKVDAGDIGAGHSVTALYEITPVNSSAKLVDELRYKKSADKAKDDKNSEYAFVKIRYKLPNSDTSKLITTPVNSEAEYKTLDATPVESRFATSVAAFGQLLRGDAYMKDFNYDQVISLAENAKGDDKFGYRAEFINLVRIAKNAPALPALR